MVNNDDGPVTFGPTLPPVGNGTAARRAMLQARKAAIVARFGVEVRALLEGAQEATRTAGVVLGVLRVVGLYPAPWWLIVSFLLGPFLMNVSVLGFALLWKPRLLRRGG